MHGGDWIIISSVVMLLVFEILLSVEVLISIVVFIVADVILLPPIYTSGITPAGP